MKISTRARYSIRLMIYLADHMDRGTPIQLKEVSRNQNISMRYMEQLVVPLKNAQLVKAVQGKHGGYALARDPGEIFVNEIIEASIGPVKLIDCLEDEEDCEFTGACGLRKMWGLINVKITDVLNQYTLVDLSEKRMRELKKLEDGADRTGVVRCCLQ